MPDIRFFQALGPVSLGDLALATGARLEDPARAEQQIMSVAPLASAGPDTATFLLDARFASEAAATRAGACFVHPKLADRVSSGSARLLTAEPQAAYAKAANLLHRPIRHGFADPAVHPSATLEDGVHLAPGVVVGAGSRIGAGTEVGANTVIGPGVCIGRNCSIGANVTIGFALIGDRVYILPGACIGQAGFGVAASSEGALDLPQLGRVILQDEVTVGACTCIDRGFYNDTVVGQFTKIDNLVQIAHNVVIGQNCAIAAQVGLAGSVVVGDGVQFGGKSGMGDHLTINSGARLAAAALSMRDIPAGETWCGVPARPIRRFMRELAWVTQSMDRDKAKGGRHGDD